MAAKKKKGQANVHPKGPTPMVPKSAFRDENGNIRVSAEHINGRSADPIWGPAVPEGEEVEFQYRPFETHADVRETVAETTDLVLNGIMPQAKGEFVLRAMDRVTKSLIAQQDSAVAQGANAAVGRLLNNEGAKPKNPELDRFEAMAAASEKKMKGGK